MSRVLPVVLSVAAISLFVACGRGGGGGGGGDANSPPTRSDLVEFDAGAVIAEYRDNAVRADGNFDKKLACVTGIVERVSASQFGSGPGVELRSVNRNVFGTVTMYMRDGERVSQLSAGQVVKINGTGASTVLGQPIFRDCYFKGEGTAGKPDDAPGGQWKTGVNESRPKVSSPSPPAGPPDIPATKPVTQPEKPATPPTPEPLANAVTLSASKAAPVLLGRSRQHLADAVDAGKRAKHLKAGELVELVEPTAVELVYRGKDVTEVKHAGAGWVVETKHVPAKK